MFPRNLSTNEKPPWFCHSNPVSVNQLQYALNLIFSHNNCVNPGINKLRDFRYYRIHIF